MRRRPPQRTNAASPPAALRPASVIVDGDSNSVLDANALNPTHAFIAAGGNDITTAEFSIVITAPPAAEDFWVRFRRITVVNLTAAGLA